MHEMGNAIFEMGNVICGGKKIGMENMKCEM